MGFKLYLRQPLIFELECQYWQDILQKSYFLSYEANIELLPLSLTNKLIALTGDDIVLFCVERNEILSLPCFWNIIAILVLLNSFLWTMT